MITDIPVDENIECVYDLSNLELSNCYLVKSTAFYYIETSDGVFPFTSISDFVLHGDKMCLVNEDKDTFKMNTEQFLIIKDLLDNF